MNGKTKPKGIRKAVALSYDADRHEAPIVVAKGNGAVADAIIRKAKDHQVPVQEDASLTEVLAQLELQEQIPPELYRLVAEVLSFIYRADRNAAGRAELGGS